MTQVTKEEFYAKIGPVDAVMTVITHKGYPYEVEWKMRNSRSLIGKSVGEYTDGIKHKYPIITKYYLP